MKGIVGAVRFRTGDKVRKHGQRLVMERLPQLWLIRVRLYCRDPETGRAYRIMRDLRVDRPTRLARIYPAIDLVTAELYEEAAGNHHAGGWIAIAIDRKKTTKQPQEKHHGNRN